MALEVVEVQSTPNPNAQKFMLREAAFSSAMSFLNASAAQDHPLAASLFEIPGVSSVLLLNDFITVNKQPGVPWATINPKVRKVLKKF